MFLCLFVISLRSNRTPNRLWAPSNGQRTAEQRKHTTRMAHVHRTQCGRATFPNISYYALKWIIKAITVHRAIHCFAALMLCVCVCVFLFFFCFLCGCVHALIVCALDKCRAFLCETRVWLSITFISFRTFISDVVHEFSQRDASLCFRPLSNIVCVYPKYVKLRTTDVHHNHQQQHNSAGLLNSGACPAHWAISRTWKFTFCHKNDIFHKLGTHVLN